MDTQQQILENLREVADNYEEPERVKSTHKAEVVAINMEPHPNADSLSIVRIFGFTICVRTQDWEGIKLGVYIQPDSIVDTTRPEFAWLATEGRTKERIKVKKLRGVVSMGCLIPAPEGAELGDDYGATLGLERYEPPIPSDMGKGLFEKPPAYHVPKYDLDSFHRYCAFFKDDEEVFVSEKLNGENARFIYHDGKLHCGSRTMWKKHDGANNWSKAATKYKIEEFLSDKPGVILYGELHGHVGGFKYGNTKGDILFKVFDVFNDGRYMNIVEAMTFLEGSSLEWVPKMGIRRFNKEQMLELAEGNSLLDSSHIREGVVIRPIKERYELDIGRVCLKIVSNGYLLK